MFPTINKKETGVNLRRIMDMRGVKPKDIQEYLGFGCVQSVYRWLDGVSMPTVDNLYALSKMLQVPMDSIVCGNAGRTKSQMDAYLIEIQKRNNCNILSDDYSFIAVWIISFIQIWIGFGMRFYERGEFKMRFSEWKKRMKSIEELKYFLICILSMFVIPIMTVVYYVVKGKIPERAINIIHFLFLGISFGAIVLILVIFFWNLRHNPNNCISKRRLNNCLNNLFNNKKIQVDYYEGVKYCIVKKSSCIALTASIDNVILDKDVQFDDEYRERLEQLLDLFEGEYTFEKYTEEDIRKNIEMDLSKFATDRKDILKEGWSKVYEVCEQKEKEK